MLILRGDQITITIKEISWQQKINHEEDLSARLLKKNCNSYGCWIFSWDMSHICANDEYQAEAGVT
jgi:hypothetical protein